MDRNALIGAWRDCIRGADKSWVLFAQGTCVILTQPEPDLAAQAWALLAEWGAVQVGTPAGDFARAYGFVEDHREEQTDMPDLVWMRRDPAIGSVVLRGRPR